MGASAHHATCCIAPMPDHNSKPDSHPPQPARKLSFHPQVSVLHVTNTEQQLAHAESALLEETARLNWMLQERSRIDVLQSNARQYLRDMQEYVRSAQDDMDSSTMYLLEMMQSFENGGAVTISEMDQWVAVTQWHSANYTQACTRLSIATESDNLLRATAESFSDQAIDYALQEAMDAAAAVNEIESQFGYALGMSTQEAIAPPAADERVHGMNDFSMRGTAEPVAHDGDPWYLEPDPPVYLWRIDPVTMNAGWELHIPQQVYPVPCIPGGRSEEQQPDETDGFAQSMGHYSAY